MASIITDIYEFWVDTILEAQWEDGQILPSGRRIYRHSSNQGSVIEFDYWGIKMKLFVADAKYRAAGLAYDTTQRSHGNPQLSVTTAYFNGSADFGKAALSYTKDDTWIQSTYASLKNDGTAKSNTDFLMNFDTTDAAHHCRDQNISGVGQLDLPNLYELIILYLESDNIDALDPTAESNRDKALGKMNTYGRFAFGDGGRIWSSTGHSSYAFAWPVYSGGQALHFGQIFNLGVVPVKELTPVSSRKIYRHSSNQGSVIEFDYWGTKKKLFVADAKYRATNLAYDTPIQQSHGNPQLSVTTDNFNGSEDDPLDALTYTKDDSWIQSTYPELKNDGTAKSNTDFLMKFDTTDAAHHCRDQNISGVGQLDLPNLYELIILYLESDRIDAFDPTAESNRDKALGKMQPWGRFNFDTTAIGLAWSSTQCSRWTAQAVRSTGITWTPNQLTSQGVVPVKELIKITPVSSRKIYRHSSNQGSVIEFDYWGTKKKLFVADAKYRATNLAYDTPIQQSHGNPQLSVTTDNFNGSEDDPLDALTYTKDDSWIQSTYPELKNDGTAKSNTDFLMKFDTTKAAHHCRDQYVTTIGQLDLPNLYELIILYLESDNIDVLDPTVSSNRDKALGVMNTNGRFNFNNRGLVWSSTESNSNRAWGVRYDGRAYNLYQNVTYGVTPIKELDD